MQCPGCRKPVPEGAKFCGFCGAALSPAVPHPTVRGEAPPVSGPEAGPGAVFRVAGPEEAAPPESVGEAGRRGFPWVLVWALAGAGLAFLVYWFGVGRTGRGISWPQRPNPAMDQFSWSRAYGGPGEDGATAIASTPDGGYIVAGWTESFGVGKKDVWVLKLDGRGNVQWQKTYGGANSDDASAIAPTSDGGYVVAGETWSFGAGWNDVWVLKLDRQGDVQWQKTYGGRSTDRASTIAPTSDGGYIVGGWTMSFATEMSDAWVLKLDGQGNVQWQKTYGVTSYDSVSAIVPRPDGGYVVVGDTGDEASNVWVLKLDGRGNGQWLKTYGESFHDDHARGIIPTSDGGYIVVGGTRSFDADKNGVHGVWVLKLDGKGNVQWQKRYGGPKGPKEEVAHDKYAIAPTSDGGYIVVGRTGSFGAGSQDVWVLKLEADGSIRGCPSGLVRDSTASVAPTTVSPRNSSAVVRTTSASVRTSSATVKTTSVSPTPVCRGE